MIESSKMGWARHAARIGEKRGAYRDLVGWGNLKSGDDLKELGGEGWILLKRIYKKYVCSKLD